MHFATVPGVPMAVFPKQPGMPFARNLVLRAGLRWGGGQAMRGGLQMRECKSAISSSEPHPASVQGGRLVGLWEPCRVEMWRGTRKVVLLFSWCSLLSPVAPWKGVRRQVSVWLVCNSSEEWNGLFGLVLISIRDLEGRPLGILNNWQTQVIKLPACSRSMC